MPFEYFKRKLLFNGRIYKYILNNNFNVYNIINNVKLN